MDRILEGYLNNFITEKGLEHLEKEAAFEQFVNFTVLSKIITDPIELENVSVGGGNDTAIDGLAILVNEHLVSSKEEIDYFRKNLRRLDVRFVFIQAKTSDKFDMGAIGNFLFGVKDFFDKVPSLNWTSLQSAILT